MLLTALLCAAISGTELGQPASALDAIDSALVARLPDNFAGPDQVDPETAALFATPVAKVNGRAILAGTILVRWDDYLQHVKLKLSPEEYAKTIHEIIQKELPGAIINQAVLHEAEIYFQAEKQVSIRPQLEFMWEVEKLRLARELARNNRQYLIRFPLDGVREEIFRKRTIQFYLEYLATKFDGQPAEKLREHLFQIRQNAKIETAYSIDFTETNTR